MSLAGFVGRADSGRDDEMSPFVIVIAECQFVRFSPVAIRRSQC
jgi:hypothetical protein